MENLSKSLTIYKSKSRQYTLCMLILIAIPACSGDMMRHFQPSYPLSEDERELARIGRITGPSGFELYVSGEPHEEMSTNNKPPTSTQQSKTTSQYKGDREQYLWQAALEVTKGIPLLSTDRLGGVIVTDWHTQNVTSNERHKFCIYIIKQSDNTYSTAVTAFTQRFDGTKWHDVIPQKATAMSMKKKIIEKLRSYK